jgi:hypothetical protein
MNNYMKVLFIKKRGKIMENKIKYIIIAIIAIVIIAGAILAVNMMLTSEDGSSPLADAGVIKTEYTMSFYGDNSEMRNPSSEADSFMSNQFMKEDMDNNTMDWLKGFDSNYVYISGPSSDYIMSRSDYNKLKSNIDTSELGWNDGNMTYYSVTFKADTGDIKPLGGGYKDVIQVSNVDFVSKELKSI